MAGMDEEQDNEMFEMSEADLRYANDPLNNRFRQTKQQAMLGVFAQDGEGVDEEDAEFAGLGFSVKPSSARQKSSGPVQFISGASDAQEAKNIKILAELEALDELESAKAAEEDAKKGKKPRMVGGLKAGVTLPGEIDPMTVEASRIRYDTSGLASMKGLGTFEKHTKGVGSKILQKFGYVPGRGLGKDLQGISTPVEAQKRVGKGAIGYYGAERKRPPQPKKNETDANEGGQQKTVSRWRKSNAHAQYNLKSSADLIDDYSRGKMRPPSAVLSNNNRGVDNVKVPPSTASQTVKIIDMTGKQRREYDSYNDFSKAQALADPEMGANRAALSKRDGDTPDGVNLAKAHFDVPELRHNLDVLVEDTEKRIVETARRRMELEDKLSVDQHAKQELSVALRDKNARLNNMDEVLELIDKITFISDMTDSMKDVNGAMLNMDRLQDISNDRCMDCLKILNLIYSHYEAEFHMFQLIDLVVPIMKNLVVVPLWSNSWNPLTHPYVGLEQYEQLKEVITGMGQRIDDDNVIYTVHLMDAWLPVIRRSTLRWKVREDMAFVDCLTKWESLIPTAIWNSMVCEQLILPKLRSELEQWNPMEDPVPVHTWIHPWLPLLGGRMDDFHTVIRHKIGCCLKNWHPSDSSLKQSLSPWLTVWSPGHLATFLNQYAAPKLAELLETYPQHGAMIAMDEATFDAHAKFFNEWLIDPWMEHFSRPTFVSLICRHFFHNWHNALVEALNRIGSPGVTLSFGEISAWYQRWKRRFPHELLTEPLVRDCLTRALHVMSQSASGKSVALAPTRASPPAPPTSMAPSKAANLAMAMGLGSGYSASADAATFSLRELVERRAGEANLAFRPCRLGQSYVDGHNLWQLGDKTTFFIDRNVIYVKDEQTSGWSPVSITQLFDIAISN